MDSGQFIYFVIGLILGVPFGIGLMCYITIKGGCYEGCLMRECVAIRPYNADADHPAD